MEIGLKRRNCGMSAALWCPCPLPPRGDQRGQSLVTPQWGQGDTEAASRQGGDSPWSPQSGDRGAPGCSGSQQEGPEEEELEDIGGQGGTVLCGALAPRVPQLLLQEPILQLELGPGGDSDRR